MTSLAFTYLPQRWDDGAPFFLLCVRHAEGGALAPVRSTDRRAARSSPTRREYFVCDARLAGARPTDFTGAVSGAGGYVNNAVATGQDITGEGFVDATWKGGVAGAVGGGVGAYIGPGAFGAMGGGFAGGATGSALNGGDGWEILKGGLMGAGGALASYSMVWGYNNYSGGEEISRMEDISNPTSVPQDPEGSFVPDDLVIEAESILSEARNSVATNGENPLDYEAAGSFRVRQYFWSGKNYLTHGEIVYKYGVNSDFISHTGDTFRVHLHPADGVHLEGMPIGTHTSSYHPSKYDYGAASIYQKYGIQSYASAMRGNTTELYHYTYNNGTPKYWQASW